MILAAAAFAQAIPDPAPQPPGSKPDSAPGLGKYEAIVERAPFRNRLVPQTADGGATPESGQLRLNGIIRIGDRLSAGIEDTVQRRSLILPLGQRSEEGIEVQAIDEASQTVRLVYNGRSMTLSIEKTPGMSGVPMPAPVTTMPSAVPAPAGVQPARQAAVPITYPPGVTNQPAQIRRKRIIIPRDK